MVSNAHSDQETGHESGGDKSLLSMSDDVLVMTVINLTLDERIGIERTSKRIKAAIDRILSLQKIFAISPRKNKSVLMKSWSPLQSEILCTHTRLYYYTLSWRGRSSALSILSQCSALKLVNLEGVDVRGIDLATWCPLVTHFVTDKVAKAADYVQELIKNKKDVLIESFEYQPLSKEPDADLRILSKCPRLNTLICPIISDFNIPPDVLSKVKILSVFVHGNMDNLIKHCSKNVEQLTIKGPFAVPVQLIADNFRNLVHLQGHIRINDINQLIKLRNIQSIKALSENRHWWSWYLNSENVATFEQFLSTNGNNLKYLRIDKCVGKLINRAVVALSNNCPNLICFKIKNGINLKVIHLDTIKSLPSLEKIHVRSTGTSEEVEKVKELLLRCKNSLRKVALSNENLRIFSPSSDGKLLKPDLFDGREMPMKFEHLIEIISILRDHKRTCGNEAQKGKPLSWVDFNWNGSSTVYNVCPKMSFLLLNQIYRLPTQLKVNKTLINISLIDFCAERFLIEFKGRSLVL